MSRLLDFKNEMIVSILWEPQQSLSGNEYILMQKTATHLRNCLRLCSEGNFYNIYNDCYSNTEFQDFDVRLHVHECC